MSVLRGKSILLGLSGGIAVYKSASLLRRLVRDYQCNVRVIMTRSAQQFMSPLIFETFSGTEVITDMFHAERETVGTRHIDLVRSADLFAVIPATANSLGKVCSGIADDALSTMLMAADPERTLLAPAMNKHMYHHPAVQENLRRLREMRYRIVEPDTGELATAVEGRGVGRLPDEHTLLHHLEKALYAQQESPLAGKRVLITGGPTREAVDALRLSQTPSSGKMGTALAECAAAMGAEVIYVSGPVSLPDPVGCRTVHVGSAAEMKEAVLSVYEAQDIVIMAAAVEDIRPRKAQKGKIKKRDPDRLELERSEDILKLLGERKEGRIHAGFSAEYEDEIERSRAKLREKHLDWIVVNNPEKTAAAFGGDSNKVTVLGAKGEKTEFPLLSKREIAEKILQTLFNTDA